MSFYIIFFIVFIINFSCNVWGIQPNILFIVVDDLRPSLGTYGDNNAVTPNIDRLASTSFVFRNTFAQQALCAPSRNSFLTSRRPDSLHLYDFYNYWRNTVGNFTTLPQYFRQHGYFTHSIGKVFHPGISSNFNDDSKYSWSDTPFHPKTEIYKESKVCINSDGTLGRNLLCPVIPQYQPGSTLPDMESTVAATEFLDLYKNKQKPFFLAIGLHKPHIPFKFPVEYLGNSASIYSMFLDVPKKILLEHYHPLENVTIPANRWRPSLLPTVAWNPWNDIRHRDDMNKLNIPFPFGPMPDEITKKIIQHYNAATTYIDDLIGQILAKVNKKNTIIILTSDHGWSMGEHGEFSKFSNFDIATRVPLIIHVPGLNKGEVIVNQLSELVDLFPTLVDLAGLSPRLETCQRNGSNAELCTEGRSLLPIMLNSLDPKKFDSAQYQKSAVFSQYPRPGDFPMKQPDSDRPRLKNIKIMGYSIRTDRYRYTQWVGFNNTSFKPDWRDVHGVELYDHLIDPGETLNLAGREQMNYTITALRKRLILGWRYV